MINRVVLAGRLTKDIELRTTGNGTSVTQFTLAVDRRYRDANGNRQADFPPCVAWKKTAEILKNYAHKGDLIGAEGSIQTRTYENKEGTRVYVTEVVVDSISLLGSRNDSQGRATTNNTQAQNASDPFSSNSGSEIDITEDDLPF